MFIFSPKNYSMELSKSWKIGAHPSTLAVAGFAGAWEWSIKKPGAVDHRQSL